MITSPAVAFIGIIASNISLSKENRKTKIISQVHWDHTNIRVYPTTRMFRISSKFGGLDYILGEKQAITSSGIIFGEKQIVT